MTAALSADQLNSFLEKLDILCEKLKIEDCPVCDLKLNDDKVSCTRGHGICGSCKQVVNVCPVCNAEYSGEVKSPASAHPPSKRPRHSTENGEIVDGDGDGDGETESSCSGSRSSNSTVDNTDGVPNGKRCTNAARGCQASLADDDVLAHEAVCTFRQYTCKICSVEICLRKLQGHCERSHSNFVVKDGTFKSVTQSETENKARVYYFVLAQNEIFWFWRNNCHNRVFTGLQYCGDVEKASEFKYTLEVVSMNQKNVMKFGGPVLFDTPEMPRYSPSEDYIIIGKNFIDAESKFKITVTKL